MHAYVCAKNKGDHPDHPDHPLGDVAYSRSPSSVFTVTKGDH